MKKYFVTSDVHSFYEQMMTALNEAGFDRENKDHVFVSCGDLFDRGPDGVKCLRFVNELEDDRKILIRGNHEDLLEELLSRGRFEWYDLHNRTDDTIRQFSVLLEEKDLPLFNKCRKLRENEELKKYYEKLQYFYEADEYIFLHGYIPVINNGIFPEYDPNWRQASDKVFEEAAWLNGYEMWQRGIKEEGKTIVCGHIHTSYGHHNLHHDGEEFGDMMKTGIFYDDGIIGLDACTAYSGKVNVLVLEF